jgi:hypothetical protein
MEETKWTGIYRLKLMGGCEVAMRAGPRYRCLPFSCLRHHTYTLHRIKCIHTTFNGSRNFATTQNFILLKSKNPNGEIFLSPFYSSRANSIFPFPY